MTYRINAEPAGLSFQVEVTPTLEALGDQPWRVVLRGGEGAILHTTIVEESCGLSAATEALETYLKNLGIINQTLMIKCK